MFLSTDPLLFLSVQGYRDSLVEFSSCETCGEHEREKSALNFHQQQIFFSTAVSECSITQTLAAIKRSISTLEVLEKSTGCFVI